MSRTILRLQRVLALLAIVSLTGPLTLSGMPFRSEANAATDAVITGKLLKTDGTVPTFTCPPPPPGITPPPAGTLCTPGIGAIPGPGQQPFFTPINATTGSFTLNVNPGIYRLEINGPMEQMSQYKFPAINSLEIQSGQTKDLGTITLTQKQGHIQGTVKDSATNTGVSGVTVSCFPMFQGGPGGPGGDQGGPIFPSTATSTTGGAFDILVNAGRCILGLDNRPDAQYVSAGGPPVEVNVETDTSTVSGLTVNAIKADVTITGRILDSAGTQIFFFGGVGARPVGSETFMDFNGPIMPDDQGTPPQPGQIPTKGRYSVKVSSSVATQYQLNVHTPPEAGYSSQSNVTVTVTPNSTITQDLTMVANTSTIFGKVVSSTGFALSSCQVDASKGGFEGSRFGEVFAHNPQGGGFGRADIKTDCSYTLSLGAGDYQFGYRINSNQYMNRPAPPTTISVAANQNVEKNITVEASDAQIKVQVFAPDGTPIRAWVEASDEGQIREQFKNGGKEGPPGGGPGQGGPGQGRPGEGEFRGPGNTKDPQAMMKYCTDKKNEKECRDFKLPPGSGGPGGCANMLECTKFCTNKANAAQCKDGGSAGSKTKFVGKGAALSSAAASVRIKAEDVTKGELKGPDLARDVTRSGVETGADGKGVIPVVSGKIYEIFAFIPPHLSENNYLPPQSVKADLRTAKSADVVVRFGSPFGTMTGKVTLPNGSAPRFCHIGYWSEDGTHGNAGCNANGSGTFSLPYSQGKLHVAADSFDGNTLYRSDEEIVVVTTQKTLTKNFTLKESQERVFAPATSTFDAGDAKTISLDNGAELTIPALALGADGENVTVTATPTVSLSKTESVNPGLGYTFEARDSSGQVITDFNANVTLTLPYEESTGLDERFQQPKFVNDTTGAYDDPDSATQDTGENTFTISTDHFSTWTVVSPGGEDLQSVTYETSGKNTKVTINSSKSFSLKGKSTNWNVSTGNFGDKAGGQLIVVSNTKSGGKVLLYTTAGKLKKTIRPIAGFKGGLNQLAEDVTANSGKIPDGIDDIIVAPATEGPAKAVILNLAANKTQTVTTGVGVGKTTVSSAELVKSGIANLTTLFKGTEARAFAMQKANKLSRSTKKSVTGLLSIKNGVVEKKTVSPKIKKTSPASCSTSKSTKITLTGTGMNGPVVALWNASAALSATAIGSTKVTFTINPSSVDVNAVNTLTLVNADGQATVAIVKCK